MRLVLVSLAALALSSGSAYAETPGDSTARDTAATRPAARDSTARRPAPGAGVVPADSLPSADARAVLRAIDEPLSRAEQVDPPDSVARAVPEVAAPDTAAAETTGVPIPEETAPLGEGPGGPARSVFSDSAGAARPGSGTSAPGPAAPPRAAPGAGVPPRAAASAGATPAAAPADTCWRLQLAAPTDREEAEARRAAAESQLMVGFVIEVDHGRHKVRGRDCQPRTAAEALRDRALLSGFAGAFLVRMGPAGLVIPAAPPAKRETAKPAAATKRRANTAGKGR